MVPRIRSRGDADPGRAVGVAQEPSPVILTSDPLAKTSVVA